MTAMVLVLPGLAQLRRANRMPAGSLQIVDATMKIGRRMSYYAQGPGFSHDVVLNIELYRIFFKIV